MKCTYASDKLSNAIWPDFTAHFQSESTSVTYLSDMKEIMEYNKKDFLELNSDDVADYYADLKKRVEAKLIQPSTALKKMREAHSFSEYIMENKTKYEVKPSFQDYFFPYIGKMEAQRKFAHTVPVEHVDRLLEASEPDLMAYTIITLIFRMGLTSSDIIGLKTENLSVYENAVVMDLPTRKDSFFVPSDVVEVISCYLQKSQDQEYMFCNRRGSQLNTMYISRMMKKYTEKAGIPAYSARDLRNTCATAMFAYGADDKQVAEQMGTTCIQIRRYKNLSYKDTLKKEMADLVKLKIQPPR